MCGIFGQISGQLKNQKNLRKLANHAMQRGLDSSGFIYYQNSNYKIIRANFSIDQLFKKVNAHKFTVALGHSRLITNGLNDNQPVVIDDICAIHNGIIVNEKEVWKQIGLKKKLKVDSEVIVAIAKKCLSESKDFKDIPKEILSLCKGTIACALVMPSIGKILLFSNNGSLYIGYINSEIYFSSESYPLSQIGCNNIKKIKEETFCIDIPQSNQNFLITDSSSRNENLIPKLKYSKAEESLLEYRKVNLKRCTRCILPETMPFIYFDSDGVCNYCHHYVLRNKPQPKEELFNLVEPYRKKLENNDCIVPFSGGRDSCYALHLIVNELKMKPITYTYDWGMITDLGRRNISMMCSKLGVENIIVAADISQKRKNIAMNLKAWLKSPNLGMISILTAGDKHFFKYVETIKKQTGIHLNLWGINPLEVTHFKAGFLGMKPNFEEKHVYTSDWLKQLKYQYLRLNAMLKSLGYFNYSLWDTLSGEFYRSFTKKNDYYHIFDYWRWDEELIDKTLSLYGWEKAVDTNTTWRIGDGTAAFYNYIYFTLAGFTEHDTFRSNQIREGEITREKALNLVQDENRPRYQNIRWYLDTLNFDFKESIKIINNTPKLFIAS